jgi:hypothetical protein
MPDGAALVLDDGREVHVGHRELREGARVTVIHLPGLMRLDVRRTGDTFSFALRNLRGTEQSEPAPLDARTHRPQGGPALNEYDFRVGWVDGPQIRLIVRMPPYTGELVSPCSAYAIMEH